MPRSVTTAILCLVLVSLACGSSAGVQVSTPSGGEPNEATEASSEPAVTEEASPPGTSLDNPAPLGGEVSITDYTFVVTNVIRPANEQVQAGNQFNPSPDEGQEYLLVELAITCTASETCTLFPSGELKVVGSGGLFYDGTYADVPGLLDINLEWLSGATVSGSVLYLISTSETNLVLVYEPMINFTDVIAYMALE